LQKPEKRLILATLEGGREKGRNRNAKGYDNEAPQENGVGGLPPVKEGKATLAAKPIT